MSPVKKPPTLGESAAIAADAQMYAKDFGVSVDEAARRLVRQQEYASVVAGVAATAPEAFAGATIDNGPSYGLTIYVTDAPAVRVAAEQAPFGADADVRIENSRSMNERDVVEAIEAIDESALRDGGVQGVGYDASTGSIVVDILEPGTTTQSILRADLEPLARVGLPVMVQGATTASADSYRGGINMSSCTSGFNVLVGGTRGMTTAGHCGDDQDYKLFDSSTWVSTTFKNEARNQSADVQWHTPSLTPGWAFHGSSTTATTLVTGKVSRVSQVAGTYVCHRGKSTGFSCGTVDSNTYRPTYTGACPGTCAPTWVKFSGASLKCYGGDSGGVVFSAAKAYGLLKGSSSTGTTAAACNYAFYMPIDYLSSIGATLLVSP